MLTLRIMGRPEHGRESRVTLGNENARRVLALARAHLAMLDAGPVGYEVRLTGPVPLYALPEKSDG